MVMMTMHAVSKPCMCLIYRPSIDIKNVSSFIRHWVIMCYNCCPLYTLGGAICPWVQLKLLVRMNASDGCIIKTY